MKIFIKTEIKPQYIRIRLDSCFGHKSDERRSCQNAEWMTRLDPRNSEVCSRLFILGEHSNCGKTNKQLNEQYILPEVQL